MQVLGHGAQLFMKGLRRFDLHLMDAGLTFIIPNYAMLANITLVGFAITLFVDVPGRSVLFLWFLFLLGAQLLYFFMGVGMSNLSFRVLSSLGFAPFFLVWRMVIDLMAIFHLKHSVWIRTARVPNKEKPRILAE
jgi:hypothetical protein